jgi:hypothetical protein
MEISKIAEQYPIMNPSTRDEVREVLEANLGPRGLSERNLERIKVPTGGGLTWTVPSIDGEELLKELSGIDLAWREIRLYWKAPFSERGKTRTPPDCSSKNGLVGIGDPGGDCTNCPLAQFGSDPKGGRGQACKQVRQLLILRPDHILPEIVSIPPTSHRNAEQYFNRLASRRIPFWSLITNLKLERTANADGIDYARIVFSAGPLLSENERQAIAPFQKQMQQVLRNIVVDTSDYEEAPPEPEDFTPPAGSYRAPIDD